MDTHVSTWVRLGLAIGLAPPLIVTGLWAVLAPQHWYEQFPGLGPHVVAAEPPYNAHLVTDAGAGFLAIGAALLAAAALARRSAVYTALIAYLVHTLPHIVYHATNPAPGLSGTARVGNVLLLVSGAAIAVVLAWGARREPSNRRSVPPDRAPTAQPSRTAATP